MWNKAEEQECERVREREMRDQGVVRAERTPTQTAES